MQFFTPLQYIQIDIANQYGLDKEQFEDRLAWVINHEKDLETLETESDDLYRYAAAVMAYREVQAGKPTGHRVGFDACSSGPQIMSCVMRDMVGAENTSLVGKKRNDPYKQVTTVMNSQLTETVNYDRKTIKGVLMPCYYGSLAKPIELFGKDTPEHKAFMNAKAEICPGAEYLMPILRNSWNAYAKEHSWVLPDGFVARVKVLQTKEKIIEVDELDHLKLTYQYKVNEGVEKGIANIANPIQSIDGYIVRELTRRCNYDKFQFSKVLTLLKKRAAQYRLNRVELDSIQKIWRAQKIISLVDLEELHWGNIKTFDFNYCNQLIAIVKRCLERPSFPVVTIHDEFTCHPNYMNWVRLTYMEIMAEISDSMLIDDILSKLYGQPVILEKMADSISAEILNGEYAIT